MKPIFRLGIIATALALGQQALAQEPVVTSMLTANRVEFVDGKPTLQPAYEAKPGDLLEYRASYANHGTGAIAHLQATLPIPAGTTLVADSPVPRSSLASTDGSHFAAMPLVHPVTTPDGKTHMEPVPLAEYRALRWDLGLINPGKSAEVHMQVRINPPSLSLTERP
jgi:uncharacterized repeat protein (TIGR01451 family)